MILLFLFYVLDVDEKAPKLELCAAFLGTNHEVPGVDVSGGVRCVWKTAGLWSNRPLWSLLRTVAQQAVEWKVSFSLWQVVQDWKFAAQVLDRIFLWLFLITSVTGSVLIFTPALKMWLAQLPSGAGIQSYLTHAPKAESHLRADIQPPCVYSMQTHVLIRSLQGGTVSCAVLSEAEPRLPWQRSWVSLQQTLPRPQLWLLQTFKEKLWAWAWDHEPAAHKDGCCVSPRTPGKWKTSSRQLVSWWFYLAAGWHWHCSHCFCSHAPCPAGEPFGASHWYQGNPGQAHLFTKTAGRLVTQVPPKPGIRSMVGPECGPPLLFSMPLVAWPQTHDGV